MYLKLNTQFNPLTYDELVRPLAEYGEAYKTIEDTYSNLTEQANSFNNEVNIIKSPEAYELYTGYINALSDVVEDFSKGMTAENRAKLIDMKRRYAKDITPIAKASEARKEANALRDAAGPDAIWEVSRYDSLDDFLNGGTANNKYLSSAALTQKTAGITAAAMAEAMEDPEFRSFLGGQQYMITQHTGGSYEDLLAAISNNPKAQNRFIKIKKRMMQEAGYDNFDTYGKASIEAAINTGLYAGLDKPVKSFVANGEYVPKAQRDSLAESKRQFEASMAARGLTPEGEIDRNSSYWTSQGYTFKDNDDGTFQLVKPKTQEEILDDTIASMGTDVLTFEATSAGASNGYEKKATSLSSSDTKEIRWSDIHGRTAKSDIMDYVKRAINYQGTINEDIMSDLAPYMIFERDQDYFSDNHFRVRIRGLSPSGGIEDRDALKKALTGIYRELHTDIGLVTSVKNK